MNMPVELAALVETEEPGAWCCIGCKGLLGAAEAEDYHIARCQQARRLLRERRRQYARYERNRDED